MLYSSLADESGECPRVVSGVSERPMNCGRNRAFYNTLTSNCTTIVFELARVIAPALPMDYRCLLLSGYFARYVYDMHGLTPGYRYDELQALGASTTCPLLPMCQRMTFDVDSTRRCRASLPTR